MFAKLTGTIDTIMTDSLILDVGGVGYHVFASGKTLSVIGNRGDGASLLIITHVREDHITLYGFASASEQEWFKLLTSVQGVGARSALNILSACPPDRLMIAIAAQDSALLRQAEGVGPKLAARIVTELKDKAQGLSLKSTVAPAPKTKTSKSTSAEQPTTTAIDNDAISALINLGYGRSEAFSAVVNARAKSNDNSVEGLIKLALKELSA